MDVSVEMAWNGIQLEFRFSSIQFISLALEKYKLNFKKDKFAISRLFCFRKDL